MIAVILSAVMWGCANGSSEVVWHKPGATEAELREAFRRCDPGLPDAPGESVRRDRYQAESLGKAFVDCMREQGWDWRTEKRSKESVSE